MEARVSPIRPAAGGADAAGTGRSDPIWRSVPAASAPPAAGARVSHLYIHVPFCARRCSYCDFSIAVRATTPVEEYLAALTIELHQSHPGAWTLSTIYLGGGTPSRLGGDGIARLLDIVRGTATVLPDAEITIEANPDDITAEAAAAWVRAGVNRVSLGVQSFDDNVLHWMHRTHDVAQVHRAVHTLREAGIANISIDLIFALPSQLQRDWRRDVGRAIELEPSHVSLYGLTVEPHTPLGRWVARREVSEGSEEGYEADFLHAHDALVAAGFEHYEVSNYGQPGMRSRHNSSYWQLVPYAALGPSAHRFDGETRSWNVAPYAEWLHALQRGELPVGGTELLTAENREAERVYLGLRTIAGLADARDEELAQAGQWVEQGWADVHGRTIRLTPAGWLRLDALAASLTLAGSRW